MESQPLVGQRIAFVRALTEGELHAQGWDAGNSFNTVIVLENGYKIFASRDDEGNGAGTLFGETELKEGFYVTPERPRWVKGVRV